MAVLLWRESLEAEQGEGMEVLVPIEGDTRQPEPPKWLWTVAHGGLTRRRGPCGDFYFPP